MTPPGSIPPSGDPRTERLTVTCRKSKPRFGRGLGAATDVEARLAAGQVLAFLQEPGGGLALQPVVPDSKLLRRARVTGRYNSGVPIIDPGTREIIGYELAPVAVA